MPCLSSREQSAGASVEQEIAEQRDDCNVRIHGFPRECSRPHPPVSLTGIVAVWVNRFNHGVESAARRCRSCLPASMEDAQAMPHAVRWGDADYIKVKVERGQKTRRSLIEAKQA